MYKILLNLTMLITVLGVPEFLFSKISIEELHSSTHIPLAKLEVLLKRINLRQSFERRYTYHKVLPEIIQEKNLKKGCEIGVSCGFHSYNILALSNVDILYSIDPYIRYDDPTNILNADQDFYDVFYLTVADRLSCFGSRSIILRDFSLNAANQFEDESLDFIFLDANHTYEAVKEDLEIWYSKVRSGGIVSGDDYCTIWPGVAQAVDEFFEAKKIEVKTIGGFFTQDSKTERLWIVIKP